MFVGDDGHVPPDDRDLLREEFRPVLKRLGFTIRDSAGTRSGARASRGGNKWAEQRRSRPNAPARHSSLTYQYTLPDVERETAQQNAMFDKLMEMPEGKPQRAGKRPGVGTRKEAARMWHGGTEKAVLSNWWTWSGSNRRPLPCHGSALPTAPQAHPAAISIYHASANMVFMRFEQ